MGYDIEVKILRFSFEFSRLITSQQLADGLDRICPTPSLKMRAWGKSQFE